MNNSRVEYLWHTAQKAKNIWHYIKKKSATPKIDNSENPRKHITDDKGFLLLCSKKAEIVNSSKVYINKTDNKNIHRI